MPAAPSCRGRATPMPRRPDEQLRRVRKQMAGILNALRAQDWETLRARLLKLHPSDVADLIIELPSEEEGIVFRLLPRDRSALVFAYLPPEHQEALLHSLSSDELKDLLDRIPPDDRTRLFEELPPEVTRRLLEALSPEELRNARQLLGYPENTAGRFMTPKYVGIDPGMTAAEALARIRGTGKGKETLNVVYIVDAAGKLIEDVRLGSLVLAEPGTKVTDIDDPALVAIVATDSVEDVLRAFEKYDRVALPVVDRDQKMLGIITVDDVLDLAERQNTRDMQKAGGTEALDASYLKPVSGPPPEARRLAVRSLPRRDADGDRDGVLRRRDPAGGRARAVRAAHHQQRRKLGLAGHVAHDPLARPS